MPDPDDPAEKARMDDEAFERLPPAVKLATLLEVSKGLTRIDIG